MTLVVALRGRTGPALMGSDSYLGESGSTVHDLLARPKIRVVAQGAGWLGAAGDIHQLPEIWHSVSLLESVRNPDRDFRTLIVGKMKVSEDIDVEALFVKGREIWTLDQHWTGYPVAGHFSAIGVGRDFAMGALAQMAHYGTLARNPKACLRRVMKLTAQYVDGVRPPFDYSDIVVR